MRSRTGFTLVELLITITIIAILSAIALVSYTSFVKNARDAKRQSDLKFIQSALEQYHADQKYYPADADFGVGEPLKDPFGNKAYLAKIPAEPQSFLPQYSYEARPTGCNNTTDKCTSYCIFIQIESTPPPADSRCPPVDPYNFSVSKP